jgi:hypothetical protein
MKKLVLRFLYAILFFLFAQKVAFVVLADINLGLSLNVEAFPEEFARENEVRFKIGEICNLGACPGSGPIVLLPRIVLPRDLSPIPKKCFLPNKYKKCLAAKISKLPHPANKYLLEKGRVLSGKVFENKTVKITSTITLMLNGIDKSIRNELISSSVEVSKAMTTKDEPNTVYLYLIIGKQ